MTLRELINNDDTSVLQNGFLIDKYHTNIIYFDDLDDEFNLDKNIKICGLTGGAVVTIDGEEYYIFEPFKI